MRVTSDGSEVPLTSSRARVLAHWPMCTCWSHSPGMAHRPAASSTRSPPAARSPAATSTTNPSLMRMSTGSSVGTGLPTSTSRAWRMSVDAACPPSARELSMVLITMFQRLSRGATPGRGDQAQISPPSGERIKLSDLNLQAGLFEKALHAREKEGQVIHDEGGRHQQVGDMNDSVESAS